MGVPSFTKRQQEILAEVKGNLNFTDNQKNILNDVRKKLDDEKNAAVMEDFSAFQRGWFEFKTEETLPENLGIWMESHFPVGNFDFFVFYSQIS